MIELGPKNDREVKLTIAVICADKDQFREFLLPIRVVDRNNFTAVTEIKDMEGKKFIAFFSLLYTETLYYQVIVDRLVEKHLFSKEVLE